jgi:hypothetical protein
MADTTMLALFNDIDPAANGIERLHEMGVSNDRIDVISGVPINPRMLGRPHPWTNVSRLALGGAFGGFLIGAFLNWGTPNLYSVRVGGQALTPVPPGLILLFEMTFLFALLSTFLGVFLESYFPNYRRMDYVPEISDGKIGVFFRVPQEDQQKFTDALSDMGAESIQATEARQL